MNRFFFGRPDIDSFDLIIDLFDGTHINSVRTSSVPLVAYWLKTYERLEFLQEKLKIDISKADLCFEYPTPSGAKGKSSMTDLMIIAEIAKIAIEAKFTEVNEKYKVISDWKLEGNKENKINVLDKWISILQDFAQIKYSNQILEIPYQFLHRSASACKDNKNQAIVIYQIFFDDKTKGKLNDFKNLIINAINTIKPKKNLNYYFWEIEVLQKISKNDKKLVFQKMKDSEIYEFKNSIITEVSNCA